MALVWLFVVMAASAVAGSCPAPANTIVAFNASYLLTEASPADYYEQVQALAALQVSAIDRCSTKEFMLSLDPGHCQPKSDPFLQPSPAIGSRVAAISKARGRSTNLLPPLSNSDLQPCCSGLPTASGSGSRAASLMSLSILPLTSTARSSTIRRFVYVRCQSPFDTQW